MFTEIYDEAIELFGGMKPLEIIKEVVPIVIGFILMWISIIEVLLIGG